MNINEAFPSKYIKAADLQGDRKSLVIASVTMESVSQDPNEPEKAVVYFKNAKKGLVLNRINSMAIVELYGDETDAWLGQPIILAPSKTPFQGKLVDCLRVEKPPVAKKGTKQAAPPPPADDDGFGDVGGDDIPF